VNKQIFREYDIRGLVKNDLTQDVVTNIGRSVGTYMSGGKKIAVGHDNRLSSKRLNDWLISGLLSTGCDVIDVGEGPTPMLYFSILHYKADAGIMITGSHNPIEYNGFKISKGIASIYGEEIQKLRKIIESNVFLTGEGTVKEKDPRQAYFQTLKGKIKIEKKLKVVIDAGNGTASDIAPRLFRDIGCEVIPLYCESDGSFPNHLPDPTIDEYLTGLIAKVKETGADVGIAYDGDADRVGAIDNEGNIIRGDKLLALYARDVLSKGKAKIIFDVKCSQALIEDIQTHGGEPIMWKTGHSIIKKKMREEKAPLAGEMSGHMFFADNYFGYDDGIYASGRLLQFLSAQDKSLADIVKGIPHYFSTPEIRVNCTSEEEKFKVVDSVEKYFKSKYDTIDIDGVRILFKDGWGLVRASNTQPLLVLRFEAKTQERLKEIKKIVHEKLDEFPSIDKNW